MPATVADWPQVKLTAISTGSLKEAADAHGVEYGAVRVRAHREEWPVGRRAIKAASQAQQMMESQIIKASGGAVTSVTSAETAIEKILSERRERTKLAQSQYLAKASERLAEVSDDELLEHAPVGKTLAEMASKVYPETTVDQSTHLSFFSVSMARPGQPDEGNTEEQAIDLPSHDPMDDF